MARVSGHHQGVVTISQRDFVVGKGFNFFPLCNLVKFPHCKAIPSFRLEMIVFGTTASGVTACACFQSSQISFQNKSSVTTLYSSNHIILLTEFHFFSPLSLVWQDWLSVCVEPEGLRGFGCGEVSYSAADVWDLTAPCISSPVFPLTSCALWVTVTQSLNNSSSSRSSPCWAIGSLVGTVLVTGNKTSVRIKHIDSLTEKVSHVAALNLYLK